MVRSC